MYDAGARLSPKLRLSSDVLGDGSGLRGIVATEAMVHRELLLQIPLQCTLVAHSPHLDRRRRRGRQQQQQQQQKPSPQQQEHVLLQLMAGNPDLAATLRPTSLQVHRGRPSEANTLLILRLMFEKAATLDPSTSSHFGPYVDNPRAHSSAIFNHAKPTFHLYFTCAHARCWVMWYSQSCDTAVRGCSYLHILPREFPSMPLFWGPAARAELKGTPVELELRGLEAELRRLWNGACVHRKNATPCVHMPRASASTTRYDVLRAPYITVRVYLGTIMRSEHVLFITTLSTSSKTRWLHATNRQRAPYWSGVCRVKHWR
eukprot:COSAG05_NODE_800_length_7226_cov_4.300126_4_plen_316_part_00